LSITATFSGLKLQEAVNNISIAMVREVDMNQNESICVESNSKWVMLHSQFVYQHPLTILYSDEIAKLF